MATPLPDGVDDVDYGTASLTATGGTGAYAWALAAGSDPLPTGLALAASGDITGMPTAPGTSNFTVEVTSGAQTATQALSITVDDPLHSVGEDRYVLVGQTGAARLAVVVHTEQEDRIRIISAREAARSERKAYEDG